MASDNDKQTNTPNPEDKGSGEKLMNVASVVGEACWLLSQSVLHRYNFYIADIEWMVMPPVINGQFKLFHSGKKPAALALWAYVSDEVQGKLEKGLGRLTPKDWNSGDHLWLIDLIAPYGHSDELISDLKKTSFAGKTFKYHRTSPEGKREIVTVPPDTP